MIIQKFLAMSHSILWFFLLGTVYSLPTFAQNVVVNVRMDNKITSDKSDTIYYDVNRKLNWGDFKGIPDMNHHGAAVTASGFAYSWNGENDGETLTLNISVYTYFTKSASWKKSMVNNEYHLRHEQHHFDITRLGAEKLVQELNEASFSISNYQSLITSIFNKVYDDNIALQNEYDRQTKHSLDKEKQAEWNEQIIEKIKEL